METQATFNKLTGKELLSMIPGDNVGYLDVNGETYILTPRRFEFTSRVVICKNEEADVIGVLGRFDKKEILVRI